MAKTKKEKWIEQERERLLKQHHDYVEVIRRNEDFIETNLWQIGLLHAPMRTLMNQYSFFKDHTFDEDQTEIMCICTGERTDMNPESTLYSEIKFGMKVIRKEQERLSNEIVEYRQQLKERGDMGDSYKLFLCESTDEVLSKRYDKEVSR
tara:strand:- start:30 stop:479 length:450 start_codon:yes stop_codon:yes gene_type:complete